MEATTSSRLEGAALEAWRGYLQSHAAIVRELDASLIAEHGMTTRDYEVLLYLAQDPERRLPMSALAERTMLTRAGSHGWWTGWSGRASWSACPACVTPGSPTPS